MNHHQCAPSKLLAYLLIGAVLTAAPVNADPNAMNPLAPEQESSLDLSIQLIQQTDFYREEIGRLESEFGPYDESLLEPLSSLINTLVNRRDYQSAAAELERSIQIVRIEEGLNTLSQIPLLEKAIENDIRLGEWSKVSLRFESIYNLMQESPNPDAIATLRKAEDMRNWYLQAILLDKPDLQKIQGDRIGSLQGQLILQAAELFIDDPQSLVHWLYQDAIDEYRSTAVRRVRSFIGKAPSIFLAESIFRTREQSIASSFENIKRIRKILAEQGDLEGEAMAMVYLADMRLLHSKGSALSLYRAAATKFEEAGLPVEHIVRFFSQPTVIPALEFHRTIASALQAKEDMKLTDENAVFGGSNASGTYDAGTYIAWHPYLPGIERPTVPSAAENLEFNYDTVKLGFSLNSRGQARSVDVIDSSSEDTHVRIEAKRGVESIRFRPPMVNRRWQSLNSVSMTYKLPRISDALEIN